MQGSSHHHAHPEAHARADATRRRVAPLGARALGVLAVTAVAAIVWFMLPVGMGVLLGWLLACGLYKPYRALVTKKGRGRRLCALLFAGAATLVIAGSIAVLGYLLIVRGALLFDMLPGALAPNGGLAKLVEAVARPLGPLGVHGRDLLEQAKHAAGGVGSLLASAAAQVASSVLDGMLALLFMAMTTYYLLCNWPSFMRHAEKMLPLNPHHTRALLRELRRLGEKTLFGTVATGLAQGLLAGVGFAIARVPDAAFFGAMTAVASLLPGFGTLLVWVPAASWLVATGHPIAGAFLFAWGAIVVVGVCDYGVRPHLVGRERAPLWLTFVALFGGLKLLGFVGLLVGPIVIGIALAALRIYERERQFRMHAM